MTPYPQLAQPLIIIVLASVSDILLILADIRKDAGTERWLENSSCTLIVLNHNQIDHKTEPAL